MILMLSRRNFPAEFHRNVRSFAPRLQWQVQFSNRGEIDYVRFEWIWMGLVTARIRRMGKVMFSVCSPGKGGGGVVPKTRYPPSPPPSQHRGTFPTLHLARTGVPSLPSPASTGIPPPPKTRAGQLCGMPPALTQEDCLVRGVFVL